MKSILNQTIASTHEDLHGERATKERLEHLRDGFGQRAPLYQQHDMSKETIGYSENHRVVEDAASPGDWLLKADIYYTTETLDEAMKGFSYSITERFAGNVDSGEYEVDLPYPLYNDQNLVQELVADDERLMVGRYIRKQLDDQTISILLSFVHGLKK